MATPRRQLLENALGFVGEGRDEDGVGLDARVREQLPTHGHGLDVVPLQIGIAYNKDKIVVAVFFDHTLDGVINGFNGVVTAHAVLRVRNQSLEHLIANQSDEVLDIDHKHR